MYHPNIKAVFRYEKTHPIDIWGVNVRVQVSMLKYSVLFGLLGVWELGHVRNHSEVLLLFAFSFL